MPVIMLTAMGETADRIAGLERGADDYLPKPFEPQELVLRIKSILRRAPVENKENIEKLNLGLCVYDMSKKELVGKQGQVIHITPLEQSMLSILGQKSGQIFTREKLAEIFRQNDIKEITVTRMTVPCCGGMTMAVKQAMAASGKDIPLKIVTIDTDGSIVNIEE